MQQESDMHRHILNFRGDIPHTLTKLHIQCHLKIRERNLVLILCYPALQEGHFLRFK